MLADVLVVTQAWAAVVSLLAMAALLGLAHVLIVTTHGDPEEGASSRADFRQRGVKALVMGSDGRASTSKFQALIWTLAVIYAFLFLLLWGRSNDCDPGSTESICQQAAVGRAAFDDLISHDLQTEYYVVLGFPAAAALAAKALTTNKIVKGEITKTPDDEADATGLAKGVAELVSTDAGGTDLVDFQYLAFNLLTILYFAFEFVSRPENGLPDLPTTLIALSGFAAATYTGKKALDRDVAPVITAVIPRRIAKGPEAEMTIVGSGFGTPPEDEEAPENDLAQVLLEGRRLTVIQWSDGRIVARPNDEALAALPQSEALEMAAEITVVDRHGAMSEPFTIELYEP